MLSKRMLTSCIFIYLRKKNNNTQKRLNNFNLFCNYKLIGEWNFICAWIILLELCNLTEAKFFEIPIENWGKRCYNKKVTVNFKKVLSNKINW